MWQFCCKWSTAKKTQNSMIHLVKRGSNTIASIHVVKNISEKCIRIVSSRFTIYLAQFSSKIGEYAKEWNIKRRSTPCSATAFPSLKLNNVYGLLRISFLPLSDSWIIWTCCLLSFSLYLHHVSLLNTFILWVLWEWIIYLWFSFVYRYDKISTFHLFLENF